MSKDLNPIIFGVGAGIAIGAVLYGASELLAAIRAKINKGQQRG